MIWFKTMKFGNDSYLTNHDDSGLHRTSESEISVFCYKDQYLAPSASNARTIGSVEQYNLLQEIFASPASHEKPYSVETY